MANNYYYPSATPLPTGQTITISAGTGGSAIQQRPRFRGKAEDRTEVVHGWRGYRLEEGLKLKGAWQIWEAAELEAVCRHNNPTFNPEYLLHLKAMLGDNELFAEWLKRKGADSLGRAECLSHIEKDSCPGNGSGYGCGIYGRARLEDYRGDPSFNIFAYCSAWGMVAVDEDGNWRASDCRIEKLFVVRQTGLGAFSDFIDWQRLAGKLSESYGVPTTVVDGVESVSAALLEEQVGDLLIAGDSR